jgi:hypothetical protein
MNNRKNRRIPSPGKGRDKTNASKLDATVKSLIEKLDLAGRRYQKKRRGFRDEVYASMQTAQRVIAECLKNESTYSGFVHAVQRKNANARSRSFNLSLEAMARSMAAIGDARKLASKRAKVLDYLRKIGMKVDDTAATVKKEGLENLGNKARESSGKPKKKGKPRQPHGKVKQTHLSRVGRGAPRAGHNDTEVSMVFWMKQSDRDQLRQSKLNTKFTILVSRVSEDDGDVRVRQIVPGNHLDDFDV